jgi:hypothetical protein
MGAKSKIDTEKHFETSLPCPPHTVTGDQIEEVRAIFLTNVRICSLFEVLPLIPFLSDKSLPV